MKSFSKSIAILAALASITSQPSTTYAVADKGTDFPNPVLATGKGVEVKRNQLDEAFLSYTTGLAAQGRGAIPEADRPMVKSNLLQHLIVTEILTQRATADQKDKTKKFVEESVKEARQSAPSQEAFEAQIKASGMSLDQMRTRIYEEQLCRVVLQHDTTNGVVVTDAEAKKFYDDNPDKFEQPEEVRAAHILISTIDPTTQHPMTLNQKKDKEKLARDIKARAEKGEDFGKLAKEYSDDPGSKNKGGEYKFPRGQMVPEFEAAAFSLKPGQISDLVETRYGFHIIKLIEKFPPKHETLAEEAPHIKDYLIEKKAEKALPDYLAKLKVDYNVQLTDAGKNLSK